MSKTGAFSERQNTSISAHDNIEAQSEIVVSKSNAIQDFFKIEQENENLREQVYEIQSSFTHQDREYLELAQEKLAAETEYQTYREKA